MAKNQTSWGAVADWYQSLLSGEGTYQKDLILPNLLRLLEIKKGETILDLGCGPGFFATEFAGKGAKVIGVDISKKLIEMAKKNSVFSRQQLLYFAAPANKLTFLKDESADKAVLVLAIQNMENPREVFAECARVLKPEGKLFLVLNHPAFRIPKESSWEWDPSTKLRAGAKGVQYRRIDGYLSESKAKIQTHPGNKLSEHTISFHRPLQFYFKALEKSGFCVSRLEEWSSHKKSEPGPRADAENRIRKEIPLFLFLEAIIRPEPV